MEIVICILMVCIYLVSMGKVWEIDRRVSWIEDTVMTCTCTDDGDDDDDDDDDEDDCMDRGCCESDGDGEAIEEDVGEEEELEEDDET